MSIFIIWIDRDHAKLFQISSEKMEKTTLFSRHIDHHTHWLESTDWQREQEAFFRNVVSRISEATRILILGPGVAKHHFQNYLSEHFPALARMVVGCETVDHPTDPQIAAFAKKFFVSHSA